MKGIQRVVQKLSREEKSAAGGGGGGVAYEPVQTHKITPGIPGWLDK